MLFRSGGFYGSSCLNAAQYRKQFRRVDFGNGAVTQEGEDILFQPFHHVFGVALAPRGQLLFVPLTGDLFQGDGISRLLFFFFDFTGINTPIELFTRVSRAFAGFLE